jgi:hypothetical protein
MSSPGLRSEVAADMPLNFDDVTAKGGKLTESALDQVDSTNNYTMRQDLHCATQLEQDGSRRPRHCLLKIHN